MAPPQLDDNKYSFTYNITGEVEKNLNKRELELTPSKVRLDTRGGKKPAANLVTPASDITTTEQEEESLYRFLTYEDVLEIFCVAQKQIFNRAEFDKKFNKKYAQVGQSFITFSKLDNASFSVEEFLRLKYGDSWYKVKCESFIIAMDVYWAEKEKHLYRYAFFDGPYDSGVEEYMKIAQQIPQKWKTACQVLNHRDKPLRLYMDIERYQYDVPDEETQRKASDTFLQNLCDFIEEKVIGVLCEDTGGKRLDDFVRMESACRYLSADKSAFKDSFHVTFSSIYLEDFATLEALIKHYLIPLVKDAPWGMTDHIKKDNSKERISVLDDNVYKIPQNFRLLGNCKAGTTVPFVPMIEGDNDIRARMILLSPPEGSLVIDRKTLELKCGLNGRVGDASSLSTSKSVAPKAAKVDGLSELPDPVCRAINHMNSFPSHVKWSWEESSGGRGINLFALNFGGTCLFNKTFSHQGQEKHSTFWFPKDNPKATVVKCWSHGEAVGSLPWEVYYYLQVNTSMEKFSRETQIAISMVQGELGEIFTGFDASFTRAPVVVFQSASYYLVIKKDSSFLVRKFVGDEDKIMMLLNGEGATEGEEKDSEQEKGNPGKKKGKDNKKKEVWSLLGVSLSADKIGDTEFMIPTEFFLLQCVQNTFSGGLGKNFKKSVSPTWEYFFYYMKKKGIRKRIDGHLCEPIQVIPHGPFEKPICYRSVLEVTVTQVSYDGEPEVTVETECSGEDIVLMTDRYIERIIREDAPLAVQDDFYDSDGSKGLSKYIKRFQNHPDFPLLRRDFNKIGFTNGILDSIQQVFISFKSPRYNGEWETILPAKCYPIPFKDEMNTDSARTPLWDSIYKNQFPDELDEEGNYKEFPYEDFARQKYPTQVYIEAHLGRSLYPVLKKILKGNDTVAVPYQDNKQGFMILRGQPGTGKTVLFRCVSMMLPMDVVGKLDTSVQDNFMMEEWPNKHLIIAYDMPDGKSAKGKNFFEKQFTGKVFNDLADRNMVVVNRKNLKNTSEYIPACFHFGTNDSYGWLDGGTSRRIHQFFFHNVIPEEVKDPNLEYNIVDEELPLVHLRLIRNYRKIFLDEFKDLVFDTFPVRMLQPPPIQKTEIVTKVKEAVNNCLSERFEYRLGAITFYEEFRKALKEIVEASTFSQYPDRGEFLLKKDVQDYVQMVTYYRDSNGNNFSRSDSATQGMCPICSKPVLAQAEGEEQQGVDPPQKYYSRFFLMSGCNKLKLHKGDSKAKADGRRVLNENGSRSQFTGYNFYFINMMPKGWVVK